MPATRSGKLGVVGALTFSNSLQTIFDQERNYYFPPPGYAQGVAGAPVLQSAFDYDESTESSRLGGVFNLSYQFSPAHKVAWRNFYSHDTDDNARYYEGYYQDFNTDIRNQRLRYIERTIQNSQVESEHLFKGPGQQRPDLVDGLLPGRPATSPTCAKACKSTKGEISVSSTTARAPSACSTISKRPSSIPAWTCSFPSTAVRSAGR